MTVEAKPVSWQCKSNLTVLSIGSLPLGRVPFHRDFGVSSIEDTLRRGWTCWLGGKTEMGRTRRRERWSVLPIDTVVKPVNQICGFDPKRPAYPQKGPYG